MLFLLDDDGESLGSLGDILRYLVLDGDEFHHTVETLLEEVDIHVLGASDEEEVDFDTIALSDPLRDLLGLEFKVMFSSAYFDLDNLEFAHHDFRLGSLLLLLFIVLILTVIHDLGDRRSSSGGDLNEVEGPLLSLCQCDGERYNTEILSFGCYDAQLGRFNLMVYFDADGQLIGITGVIYSMRGRETQGARHGYF